MCSDVEASQTAATALIPTPRLVAAYMRKYHFEHDIVTSESELSELVDGSIAFLVGPLSLRTFAGLFVSQEVALRSVDAFRHP